MLLFIVVACSLPTPEISLGPRPADTTTELVVTPGPAEGESFEYRWSVGGVVQGDLVGNHVSPTRTARGQKWSVAITRVRSNKRSPQTQARITIANAPPAIDVAVSEGREGLEAILWATDPDGDPVTTSWKWSVGDVHAQNGGSIAYADLVDGQTWTLTATATDGTSSTTASTFYTPGNQPPILTSARIDPVAPTIADMLTLDIGATDPDGDPLTVEAVWRADGAIIHEGETLPAGRVTVNQAIDAIVIITDGTLRSAPITTPVARIVNGSPSIQAVRVQPPILSAGTAPHCEVDGWFDPDGEPELLRFRWFINGIIFSETASPSASQLHKGDLVACEATAIDAESVGTTLLSNDVLVANTPPSIARVRVEPEAPIAGDTLTAFIETPYDPDADPIAVELAWIVNGDDAGAGLLGEGSSPGDGDLNMTLVRGDVVEVEAVPFDLEAYGIAVRTEIEVGNTIPVITGLILSPDPALGGQDVTVAATTIDADGDDVTIMVRWQVNGGAAKTSDVLPAAEFSAGDLLTITVLPDDGIDEGELFVLNVLAE